jgi:hypothetical protein
VRTNKVLIKELYYKECNCFPKGYSLSISDLDLLKKTYARSIEHDCIKNINYSKYNNTNDDTHNLKNKKNNTTQTSNNNITTTTAI